MFVSAATDEAGFDANYQSIASIDNQTDLDVTAGVDVSRSFDRELLEEQTQIQASQREAALGQLVESTEARAADLEIDQWVTPVVGYRLTSLYGEISGLRSGPHTGVDLAAPTGTSIVAVTGGTVTLAGSYGACGTTVEIQSDDGWSMRYCHQSSVAVSEGQTVEPGELIGYVGSTGNSTGPHLHLEILQPDGEFVNPIPLLSEHGVEL